MKILCILAACALLMTAPLFILFAQGLAYSGDLIVYTSALKLFGKELAHGDFYPRFLPDANGGLGSPMFLFYPPLAFYLSSVFQPLSAIDPNGWYRLACSMWLACFVSGLACYSWLKPHYPPRIALAGAIIYVLLPYRLIYIYHDFALAQLWALAWLPLLMWATERIERREPRATAACAVVYALLVLTHIPSFITCAGLPFLLVLLRQREHRFASLLQLFIMPI